MKSAEKQEDIWTINMYTDIFTLLHYLEQYVSAYSFYTCQ